MVEADNIKQDLIPLFHNLAVDEQVLYIFTYTSCYVHTYICVRVRVYIYVYLRILLVTCLYEQTDLCILSVSHVNLSLHKV